MKATILIRMDITLIAAGYMAKLIQNTPEYITNKNVKYIYSVSNCISKDFTNYIQYWKHNKYWFFDSINKINEIISDENIQDEKFEYLYYELYEKEYDEETNKWTAFYPGNNFSYNIQEPINKTMLGYDIVTYYSGNAPECSPLSCNNLANEIETNTYCLLNNFEDAINLAENMNNLKAEPGPYRIIKVSKVRNIK
jgi:hypothetical protein